MHELYRKRGRSLRYERGLLVRASEAGEAFEEDGVFRCRPWRGAPPLSGVDDTAIRETARIIQQSIPSNVSLERLILTDGVAEHECESRRWTESARRVHIALTSGSHRVLLDEGDFDPSGIAEFAHDFGRLGPQRRVERIRLAPRVVAAVTPLLSGIAPPNVVIEQEAGGVDGKGLPIEAGRSGWYRPSYRVRPVRVPMNVAARCTVSEVERELPRAIGLLAPPDDLLLHLLCVDGDDAFPAVFRIIRIDAISDRRVWYPVQTGVWAGEAEVA